MFTTSASRRSQPCQLSSFTGAGRGIGRAISEEFIRRGHRVIGTARDPRVLEDLDLAQRLALDVTDNASVTPAFQAAGDVDIVVVNPAKIFVLAARRAAGRRPVRADCGLAGRPRRPDRTS